MTSRELTERLLAADVTLWPEPNVAGNRLGWVQLPRELSGEVAAVQGWAESVERSRVVLLGMGGSSLGPEVLRAAVGSDALTVLDTTDPATVARATDGLDETALIVVSSKSGSTLEIQALLARCWELVPDGSRYVAITDPGTELDRLATEREFGRVFRNRPDIGGRYSVLSYFGLVPAALLGYDVGALLGGADALGEAGAIAAVESGIDMAHAALAGRDKATIDCPPRFAEFGLWVEQLVGESLGKQGRGVVPVPTTDLEPGADRHPMAVSVTRPEDLGAEFYRWELATAAAAHVLGVDPFDEPDVAASKANTGRVLDALPLPALPASDPGETLPWLKHTVGDGDYVSIQAYLPYGDAAGLEALRRRVRDALGGIAVTAGYGPRFLHSTGQLHKGGANNVVAVQIVPRSTRPRVAIPGFAYDFATLIDAQAIGDFESLRERGRRVLRLAADDFAELN